MKKVFYSAFVIIFLLSTYLAVGAETGQECASRCVEMCSAGGLIKDDDAYKNCLHNCLEGCYDKPTDIPDVPPPQPADTSQQRSGINANIIIAADDARAVCASNVKSSGYSCCQDTRGETKGYCQPDYTVYKDVRDDKCEYGKCYKDLGDCMRDGWGFCYTCSVCD